MFFKENGYQTLSQEDNNEGESKSQVVKILSYKGEYNSESFKFKLQFDEQQLGLGKSLELEGNPLFGALIKRYHKEINIDLDTIISLIEEDESRLIIIRKSMFQKRNGAFTALMLTALLHDQEVTNYLIENKKCDPCDIFKSHITACHLAMSVNNKEFFQILIRNYIDNQDELEKVSKIGIEGEQTALLDYAVRAKKIWVIPILLAVGCDLDAKHKPVIFSPNEYVKFMQLESQTNKSLEEDYPYYNQMVECFEWWKKLNRILNENSAIEKQYIKLFQKPPKALFDPYDAMAYRLLKFFYKKNINFEKAIKAILKKTRFDLNSVLFIKDRIKCYWGLSTSWFEDRQRREILTFLENNANFKIDLKIWHKFLTVLKPEEIDGYTDKVLFLPSQAKLAYAYHFLETKGGKINCNWSFEDLEKARLAYQKSFSFIPTVNNVNEEFNEEEQKLYYKFLHRGFVEGWITEENKIDKGIEKFDASICREKLLHTNFINHSSLYQFNHNAEILYGLKQQQDKLSKLGSMVVEDNNNLLELNINEPHNAPIMLNSLQ